MDDKELRVAGVLQAMQEKTQQDKDNKRKAALAMGIQVLSPAELAAREATVAEERRQVQREKEEDEQRRLAQVKREAEARARALAAANQQRHSLALERVSQQRLELHRGMDAQQRLTDLRRMRSELRKWLGTVGVVATRTAVERRLALQGGAAGNGWAQVKRVYSHSPLKAVAGVVANLVAESVTAALVRRQSAELAALWAVLTTIVDGAFADPLDSDATQSSGRGALAAIVSASLQELAVLHTTDATLVPALLSPPASSLSPATPEPPLEGQGLDGEVSVPGHSSQQHAPRSAAGLPAPAAPKALLHQLKTAVEMGERLIRLGVWSGERGGVAEIVTVVMAQVRAYVHAQEQLWQEAMRRGSGGVVAGQASGPGECGGIGPVPTGTPALSLDLQCMDAVAAASGGDDAVAEAEGGSLDVMRPSQPTGAESVAHEEVVPFDAGEEDIVASPLSRSHTPALVHLPRMPSPVAMDESRRGLNEAWMPPAGVVTLPWPAHTGSDEIKYSDQRTAFLCQCAACVGYRGTVAPPKNMPPGKAQRAGGLGGSGGVRGEQVSRSSVEKVKASASQADPPRAAEVVAAGITLRTFAEIEKCKLRHAAGGARGAAEVDAWLDGVCAPLAAHAADGCGPVAGAQASSRGSSEPGAATVTVSFCEGCGMSLDMIRREDPALSLLAASKTKPSARPLDAV